MKPINEDYVSSGKASLLIDVSLHTLTRWYKWWESPEFEKPKDMAPLPKYVYRDRRRTKYFRKTDIVQLMAFKKDIGLKHRGAMADFNAAYQWGKRGNAILGRKDSSTVEVRKKIR